MDGCGSSVFGEGEVEVQIELLDGEEREVLLGKIRGLLVQLQAHRVAAATSSSTTTLHLLLQHAAQLLRLQQRVAAHAILLLRRFPMLEFKEQTQICKTQTACDIITLSFQTPVSGVVIA